MKKSPFIITVAEAHLPRLDEVSQACRSAGATVRGVLPGLGLIQVSLPVSAVPALRQLRGVESVEPDGPVSLAPPDSDVQ